MDPFDQLLRPLRGDGAIFGRSALGSPLSPAPSPDLAPDGAIRFVDGAPLSLCVLMRGRAWIRRDSDQPLELREGDTVIISGPEPFVVSERPDAGQPRDLRLFEQAARPTAASASTPGPVPSSEPPALLVGLYGRNGRVPDRLLRVLPPLLRVPDEHGCGMLRDYLDMQLDGSRPGSQVVVDRLLDWLLACSLREWFDQPHSNPPPWYRALGDPVIGPALAAIHDHPAAAWTVASLAATAGSSRTTFAKRFTELLGEPPLTYLTQWRMELANDLLADPAVTIAAVAHRVGYADAYNFSAAFKRARGLSPSEARGTADVPLVAEDALESREVPVKHGIRELPAPLGRVVAQPKAAQPLVPNPGHSVPDPA